ncbi:deoxyhypusine synthase [Candidatus Woesearchaeota archaeon]|nr:deoxyhypusine synthase [Candidatus Woesearchaeota archaeon]
MTFTTMKNYDKMKHKKVEQVNLKKDMTVNQLVKEFENSGVMGAGRIARAANISQNMIQDTDCKVFLGFAGAMVPGGMKNVIIEMLKNGWIDVFVTTGANLTHDLVEALGYNHYQGNCNADDKKLHEEQVDRIYDSYMPNNVYVGLEKFFQQHWEKLSENKMNIREFLHKLGSLVEDKNSILRVCHDNNIPIFCPAISDSGIGLMVWGQLAKGKKISVGAFDDLLEILDTAWTAKKTGVIYVGGGVPKNYIQQAMQFSPKSAEYGVQITMDRPEPGGSSGAELRESISWGKLNSEAKFVDVISDATIALPLIVAAIKSRISL